jgi:inositol transporter-like SP family MFS transporter
MASYIDAAAIISFGSALVVYQHSIGLDAALIGQASGVLTLGIAAGALVGGGLGDRYGRRPVFSVTMAMIAVAAAALALSTEPWVVLAGGLLLGLGTGADLPVSLATISEAADDRNRGKLIGLSQLLWFAGILAAIGLGIAFGNAGRIGGQLMFAHLVAASLLVLVARLTIPESQAWTRASGAARHTGSIRLLLRPPLRRPLLALLLFYSLTNLSANTGGQFGTYLLVNVVGLDVPTASALGLPFLPVGVLGTLWFMAIADGRSRFRYFTVGAVLLVVGTLVPVVFGLTLPAYIASRLLSLAGAAFTGEAIMKVWVQESFPTLVRTTAQGAVIAVARVAAAALAIVTPALIQSGIGVLYGLLAAAAAVGLAAAWLVFRRRVGYSTFAADSDTGPVESA